MGGDEKTIAGLGRLSHAADDEETLISQPVELPVLFGARLPLELEGSESDPAPEDFAAAVANFLAADEKVLTAETKALFAYYEDCAADWADDPVVPKVERPADLWRHLRFTGHPTVKRRSGGDRKVYVLVPAACDWAPRRGLQLVFKEGRRLTRLGPYDGRLSTADATGNAADEETVYRRG